MAKPYAWIITEDHLAKKPEKSRAEIIVTIGAIDDEDEAANLITRLKAGEGAQFRIYDGDGGLDYVGRIIVPPGEEGGELWFAPLDWAKADTGSAEIRYLNADTGQWEVL